jgi:hypothetical protein
VLGSRLYIGEINIAVSLEFGGFSCSNIAIIIAQVRVVVMGPEGTSIDIICGASESGLEIENDSLFFEIVLLEFYIFLC